jgi:hypothetical protein
MSNPLISELISEAQTVGYNLCRIDAHDILIKLKSKYPDSLSATIIGELSDELERAARFRKVTGMSLNESDFTLPQDPKL